MTEFKEIRKEWKARKKEEENARKAEDERQRVAQAQQVEGQPQDPQHVQQPGYQQNGGARPSLPPIGYQSGDGQHQGQYAPQQSGGMVYPQQNGQMPAYSNYPNSPYAPQQGQPVYSQRQY
jgi:transcription factor CON7